MAEVKIVVLDFDGVLNSTAYQVRRNAGGRLGLDPEAVVRLNRLIADTGAEVVVSSTWRLQRTRQQLQTELDAAGFRGIVRGATTKKTTKMPDGTYARPRGLEIQGF